MSSRPLSHHPSLLIAATAFGTIGIGFGINAILNPISALSFFLLDKIGTSSDKTLIDCLMIVYGVRDIFVGVGIYAAAYFKERKTLGALLLAFSTVAFVDGYVCKVYVGDGEWGHWSYAPVLAVVGSLLLGVGDT